MEINVPRWLDASYVEKILQKFENDDSIRVSSITVRPGVPKGQNFGSDIYRVSFEFSRIRHGLEITETRSLISKVASNNDAWKEMITNTGAFHKEISMLVETLPAMNEMLAELGIASFVPECLHSQSVHPIHLTLEDLVLRGFQMVQDTKSGLDLDHCVLVVRNLAMFHAASVALVDKDPTATLTKHTTGIYHKDQAVMFIDVVKQSVDAFKAEVSKWSELSPRMIEKLSKLSDVLWEKGCEASLFRKNDFNVLNHGDLSFINIMFRYNEQRKPVDLRFVDFQFSHYGSPAIDIHYFFSLSMADDVRLNHYDFLLHEYHDSLTSTMVKLNCSTKAPSFNDLQKILTERVALEVILSCTVLAAAKCDPKPNESTNPEQKNQGPPVYEFGGQRYRKIMLELLPLYDSKGLLDI